MFFIIKLISHLPLRLLYVISDIVAFVACHVTRYRRAVVEYNMDLCLPHLSLSEKKSVLKQSYRHLADIVVETVWFGGCNKKKLHDQHIVELVNPEVLSDIAASGRSVMLLCSHQGNWELFGGVFNYNYTDNPMPCDEYDYVVAYKALRNKKWDEFMKKNRLAVLDHPEQIDGYVEMHRVLHFALANRNRQKYYSFITDQRPYRAAKGSLPVTFMGQQCQTMAAAANLAQHFGYAVIYQRMRSVKRGRYELEYVVIADDATQTSPQQIMDRYYELLTADIMAQPDQYLWTHKRFGKVPKKK